MGSINGFTNGASEPAALCRAEEVSELIDAVKTLIIPYIRTADNAVAIRATGGASRTDASPAHNGLVESLTPPELVARLRFSLPEGEGLGRDGLLETIQRILQLSVNTWDQGFLDKLYSSTNSVGVVSELLMAVLNTNSHVYQVSPALTAIEKTTGKTFARLFGFDGPRAGGVTVTGGSASNMSSIVIARNALYPDTKVEGSGKYSFILFTSEHGHYSVEKAAQACGMGSSAVWPVPVDKQGRMRSDALRALVVKAKAEGKTPLYVNATAGTTVFGSFDPFEEIAAVCKDHGLWMHVDASWGGPVVFSAQHRHKLQGTHLADSLTVNPHKMMNVPVTCSYLLGADMSVFHKANTLPAGYLFHTGEDEQGEVWDLADLTLACGRRADSLKLALSWVYFGAAGFDRQVGHAFEMAALLATLVEQHADFVLVSENPPPCLQVCFYLAPGGQLEEKPADNTRRTRQSVEALVRRGFMTDFAPGDRGSFLRVVVNWQTLPSTVHGLVLALEDIGRQLK